MDTPQVALQDARGRGLTPASAAGWRALVADLRRALPGTRHPAVVAVLMFACVFVLRLSVDASETSGILTLFIAPIVLITITYGTRAGAGAATLALGLVFLRDGIQSVHLDAVQLSTRTVVFYGVPLTIYLAGKRPREPRPGPAPPRLTPREREVLSLLGAGHTNAEIAEKLVLSVRTVESHRSSLQRKLGRPSRSELVAHARQLA